MLRLSGQLVMVVLTLGMLGRPVWAAEPSALGKAAKRTVPYAQLLQELAGLLDEVSTKKGAVRARVTSKKERTGIEVTVVTRETVELTSDFTNKILGIAVPGRRVSLWVRVEVEVRAGFDCKRVRVQVDPDYADTVVVILPLPRWAADFAEDAEAEYWVGYGRLRSKWVDSQAAAEFRKQLYAEAKAEALRKRRGEEAIMPLRELEKDLRKRFPGKRIHLRLEQPSDEKGGR
jgi:hypothetical protein